LNVSEGKLCTRKCLKLNQAESSDVLHKERERPALTGCIEVEFKIIFVRLRPAVVKERFYAFFLVVDISSSSGPSSVISIAI
jgi:hypothetical protein